jgi:peptidoglycan/LPS O-acetylase OafA/YrhL
MMSDMQAARAGTRIDVLDGWRAVSIAFVILSHLQHYSSIRSDHSAFAAIGAYGELAVQIFFVLSGFVICRGLLAELARNGRVSLLAFYVRRTFRILPVLLLYLAAIASCVTLGLVDPHASFAARALTFTCNLGTDCGGYLGGHFWSLSIEEQFYLVFPALFAAMGVFRRRAVLSLAILLPAIVLGLYAAGRDALANFLSGFIAINVGVLCALHEDRLVSLAKRLPPALLWVAIGAALVITRLPDQPVWTILDRLCLAPLIASALILSFATRNPLAPLLASRPMRFIGRISYGLYIWQQLATYPFDGAGPLFYAATISGCALICALSFAFVEQPLIRAGTALSDEIRNRNSFTPALSEG